MKKLSIFDVDRIGSLSIDESEVNLSCKNCEDEELCVDMLDCFGKVDWTVKVDRYDRELKLIFKGKKSCNLFLNALKFVVDALEKDKNK